MITTTFIGGLPEARHMVQGPEQPQGDQLVVQPQDTRSFVPAHTHTQSVVQYVVPYWPHLMTRPCSSTRDNSPYMYVVVGTAIVKYIAPLFCKHTLLPITLLPLTLLPLTLLHLTLLPLTLLHLTLLPLTLLPLTLLPPHTSASHTSAPHTSASHTSASHTSAPHTSASHTSASHTSASHTSASLTEHTFSDFKNFGAFKNLHVFLRQRRSNTHDKQTLKVQNENKSNFRNVYNDFNGNP